MAAAIATTAIATRHSLTEALPINYKKQKYTYAPPTQTRICTNMAFGVRSPAIDFDHVQSHGYTNRVAHCVRRPSRDCGGADASIFLL